MKAKILTSLAVGLGTAFSGVVWGLENPVGSLPTVPPSSIRSGLVRSVEPVGASGNLIITGNVPGGRHFRGIVPYNAISDFSAFQGSTRFDSFLRRSGGLGTFYNQLGIAEAYYSPSGTVAIRVPGQTELVLPVSKSIGGVVVDGVAVPLLSSSQPVVSERIVLPQKVESYSRFGLTPITPQEMERTLLGQVSVPGQQEGLADFVQRVRPEGIPEGLVQDEGAIKGVNEDSPFRIRPQTTAESESLVQELRQKPLGVRSREELLEMLERSRRQEQEGTEEQVDSREVIERDRALLPPDSDVMRTDTPRPGETVLPRPDRDGDTGISSELQRLLDESRRIGTGRVEGDIYGRGKTGAGETGVAGRGRVDVLSEAEEGLLKRGGRERIERKVDSSRLQPGAISQRGLGKLYSADGPSTSEVPRLSRRDRAEAILGEHESFASFAKAKYHQHVKAAEVYLKQGRYYRAADAYTMASVYDAKSPLAYAGKSHALFAAGEYMSSSLFLSRAVEIFSDYGGRLKAAGAETAGAELNLFKLFAPSLMVIGRDKLESRATDVEQWQQKSDSAELQFLLSYVYYQMGRPERAKEAIKKAAEKMPDSPAVSVLKKAVESGGQF
ncbi:MAG: tetratricopeptide repeat protein [Planctomycetota bacterium]|jgi:hypothetical protein